ncbi:hypothetical protein DCAR_0624966 [Daucus carota subsp. sativus]|uniref:Trichome birefringence-like N-terminal domain-containing protein n=1 Tax=Daucus carota subsp. sativus TaxID=79200 RepID=A0AAF0XED3_DAUCS|nr:hypothetical protein DCAR_0624966 [Daucus carota subsp. sativus]
MEQPLYTNKSCPVMREPRNCFMNGRVDTDFLKWRWQPNTCKLPRSNPKLFLEIFRGKSMAFIGDSVARNHMESLLCLLYQEEIPVNIYSASEDRIVKYRFPNHDFTLMVLWTTFLVQQDEVMNYLSPADNFTLHIDKVNEVWMKELPSALDYAIISNGHWFFNRRFYLYQDGALIGCVSCNEPDIPKHDFTFAVRMSMRTALKYTERFKGITTVLRTFSPGHYENGNWNSGGSCTRTSPLHELADAKIMRSYNVSMELRGIQLEELERAKRREIKERRLLALDITRAMLMRPDGHPDTHFPGVGRGSHDCVHWCLPGPIDAWNDLLLATLLKETG